VAQSLFSFESPLARMGVVEITGTEGTLLVPDPNKFTGDIKVTHAATVETIFEDPKWQTIPAGGVVAGRGTGVVDMARRIRTGGRPLASGELGFHILDTMIAIDTAIQSGQTVEVETSIDPIPLVAEDWDPYAATLGTAGSS
jgi:predicted dehydrogenase